jgi:hypothetical protein
MRHQGSCCHSSAGEAIRQHWTALDGAGEVLRAPVLQPAILGPRRTDTNGTARLQSAISDWLMGLNLDNRVGRGLVCHGPKAPARRNIANPSSKVVLKQDRERNLLGRAFHRGRKPVGSLGELEEFSAGFRSARFPDARVGWE